MPILKEDTMPDNPAWRLHSYLEKLLKYETESPDATTGNIIGYALAVRGPRTFNADHRKDSALYHIFELQILIDEVIEWIENRELDRELYKRPVERLWRAIMGIDPKSKWDTAKKKLDPADVRSLLYLSNEFEKEGKRNAQIVDREGIKDLLAEVDELYNAVRASGMPEDVKTFILEQLAVIKHAIRVYPYKGYKSLQEALQRNIGAMLLFKNRLDELSDNYPEVGRMKVVISRFFNIVSKAADIVTIAQPVITYLLSGGQPPTK
jgi:hypothetical protein